MLEKININRKTLNLLGITFVASLLSIGVMFALNSMVDHEVAYEGRFIETYEDIAVKTKEMVELSNEVSDNIRRISELDEDNKTSEALALIDDTISKNLSVRERSLDISNNIEDLLIHISENSGSRDSLEAFSVAEFYLDFIGDFSGYSENVEKFLESLKLAMETSNSNNRLRAEQHLDEANRYQARINNIFNSL